MSVTATWSDPGRSRPETPPPPPGASWTPRPAGAASLPDRTPMTGPAPAATAAHPVHDVLDDLVESIHGVRGAVLATIDGFGVARSASMANEPSHPAMLAAAVGLAHQLAAMGDGSALRQLLVDHDGGLLLVWPIGDERVLAVLAASGVDQRGARAFVQRRAPELVGAQQ